MVGLGSNGSSLLERTGHKFEMTEDWLILDRQERSQARRAAVIKWSMKKKKVVKPVAPVEQIDEFKPRMWRWIGETIVSKELQTNGIYLGTSIRHLGYRLPKLKKKEGKKHG